MPFTPHTESDIRAMLDTMGVDSVSALFDEIPAHLRCQPLMAVPEGLSEMDALRVMQDIEQAGFTQVTRRVPCHRMR